MKKTWLIIAILLLAAPAMAAWTITPTIDEERGNWVKIKLACTSDASSGSIIFTTDTTSGDYNATNFAVWDRALRWNGVQTGGSLMLVLVDNPASGGPSGSFTLDVINKEALSIVDEDAVANSDAEQVIGTTTILGMYPPLAQYLKITLGTLGNTNTTTVYLWIWREKPI